MQTDNDLDHVFNEYNQKALEEEDVEEEEMDARNAEAEQAWEPHRPAVPVLDSGMEIPNPAETSFRLRGGAEETLGLHPEVVEFGGRAGEAASGGHRERQHEAYARELGQTGNTFAPFSSRLEWEIARWAKLRGPSSTALTELLAIDGVS